VQTSICLIQVQHNVFSVLVHHVAGVSVVLVWLQEVIQPLFLVILYLVIEPLEYVVFLLYILEEVTSL